MFSESTEAVFQRYPRFYFVLHWDLVMCKNHPGGTGFEGMKGSWRTAEAWHSENLRRPLVKVQPPLQLMAQD